MWGRLETCGAAGCRAVVNAPRLPIPTPDPQETAVDWVQFVPTHPMSQDRLSGSAGHAARMINAMH